MKKQKQIFTEGECIRCGKLVKISFTRFDAIIYDIECDNCQGN